MFFWVADFPPKTNRGGEDLEVAVFHCRIYVFMVMLLTGAVVLADEGQAPLDGVLEPTSIATLALKNLVSRSQKVTVEKLGEIEYTAPGALYP